MSEDSVQAESVAGERGGQVEERGLGPPVCQAPQQLQLRVEHPVVRRTGEGDRESEDGVVARTGRQTELRPRQFERDRDVLHHPAAQLCRQQQRQ